MREPELQVATATYADSTTFLEDVDHAFPDVILLCEADPLEWTRKFELLQRIPAQEHLRVIVIRLDDNVLEVYDKKCLKATRKNDLINIIRHR